MQIPQFTLFFVALFVLLSVPMSLSVGLRRAKTGISLLHGDDEDLLRRIRAHGNFIEYVPLALIALAAAEIVGAPAWLVIGSGCALLIARLLHYAAIRSSPAGIGRPVGAALTTLTLIVLPATILYYLSASTI